MAWYNASWTKRKKITITGGASGAQTNYQLKLTVTWDSDMQADFDDLRFTKADGQTLIDAWMEIHTASTSATVWVKFPTTPANTVTEDYYMYYGNSGAASDWDGDNTFLLFDDFNGTSIDTTKWSYTNTPTVSGGKANFTGIKDIESKIAYDFSDPIAVISYIDINAYSSSTGFRTFGWQLPDRNDVVASLGGGWYKEGSYDRRVYGVTHDWWAGTDKGSALGESRHLIQLIAPSKLRWKCTGVKTFDDTRTETDNYPSCSTRYLKMLTSYSTMNVDLFWVIVAKAVESPATYGLGSEEDVPTSRCRVFYGPFRGPLGGPIG